MPSSPALSPPLVWLVDAAAEVAGAERFLAELGAHLLAEGIPLAGGALTLSVPHPLIAQRTWLWRADTREVSEALALAPAEFAARFEVPSPTAAGHRWLTGLGAGPVHEDAIGQSATGPSLSWIGARKFTHDETETLRQTARFAAAPLAALVARATLKAALEAYLGRRSAARVLTAPMRRDPGETIQAALLYADLRGFTALSEVNPPSVVIAALDAWFDRIALAVQAFGGEVLKFIGDGILAIFPVAGGAPGSACEAALRAVSAARAGMAHLDNERRAQGLPELPFGAALHLGEMLWGNIGAADRLDFTAIGPSVNLVSRLEGLCKPLGKTVLISGALAAETGTPLIALGTHELRGIVSPCAVFALPDNSDS
jgi:class 3 adenylate cyclase